MNFDQEIDDLIIKHMQAAYNWAPDDVAKWPRWKRVWAWWEAMAYFRHEGKWFNRLEDAPDGLRWITVMGETSVSYEWRDGKYFKMQEMTLEGCKSIYGD